jgi:hypothetical protein
MQQQIVTQPLRESTSGGIFMTSISNSLASEIEQVIMTRGFFENSVGELPWDCDFGSGLEFLRHKKESSIESDKDLVRFYCLESLRKYLPDVSITGVTVTKTDNIQGGKSLNIDITWEELNTEKSLTLAI